MEDSLEGDWERGAEENIPEMRWSEHGRARLVQVLLPWGAQWGGEKTEHRVWSGGPWAAAPLTGSGWQSHEVQSQHQGAVRGAEVMVRKHWKARGLGRWEKAAGG